MTLAAWLKALHIAALAVWAGGLLALPGMLIREQRVVGGDTHTLWQHRFSRFAYDVLISPAAVITVGSGTALLFVTWPLHGWLFVKLAAVGALAITHLQVGRIIDHIEAPAATPTRLRTAAIVAAASVLIVLILWLVLQKPAFDKTLFPSWLLRGPGQADLSSSLTLTPT